MLLHTVEELIEITENETAQQRRMFSSLRSESARINNALISLLGLYRLGQNQLPVKKLSVHVLDFLEDQIAANQLLFDLNDLGIQLNCDESLHAKFDAALIAGVVNNVLVNCAKYAKKQVTLQAKKDTQNFIIEIIDDGIGYPKNLLQQISDHSNSIDFQSGSTKLGLFFAKEIVALHSTSDRDGFIELENPPAGGGLFRLTIPQ